MALRAKETFAVDEPNYGLRVVHLGDLVDANDPVVKGRADLFEDVEQHMARGNAPVSREAVIERASAEPGEKRALGRPRKLAAQPVEVKPAAGEESK